MHREGFIFNAVSTTLLQPVSATREGPRLRFFRLRNFTEYYGTITIFLTV